MKLRLSSLYMCFFAVNALRPISLCVYRSHWSMVHWKFFALLMFLYLFLFVYLFIVIVAKFVHSSSSSFLFLSHRFYFSNKYSKRFTIYTSLIVSFRWRHNIMILHFFFSIRCCVYNWENHFSVDMFHNGFTLFFHFVFLSRKVNSRLVKGDEWSSEEIRKRFSTNRNMYIKKLKNVLIVWAVRHFFLFADSRKRPHENEMTMNIFKLNKSFIRISASWNK